MANPKLYGVFFQGLVVQCESVHSSKKAADARCDELRKQKSRDEVWVKSVNLGQSLLD